MSESKKWPRDQVVSAAVHVNDVHANLTAAYWVSEDGTRDYLVADAIKAMTTTLMFLGKRVVDAEPAAPEATEAQKEGAP